MHRPSLPQDLDPPEQLWARATTLALLEGEHDYTLGDDRLSCWNSGGSYWWRLTLFPGGRAMFCGQDSDGSLGHLRDDPVDFLAGGPDWLPWEQLRDDAEGMLFGYLYWWQDGAWSRAPYPDDLRDDGLEMSASWVADDLALCDAFEDWVATEEGIAALRTYLRRAANRTVDADALGLLLDTVRSEELAEVPDVEAAMAFVRRARLVTTPDPLP